jgi:nucleoside phosphorylase
VVSFARTVVAVSEHELVVHVYAHADGPYRADAAAEITAIWARCRDELLATDPVPALGLPTDPAELTGFGPDTVALAARQRPDTHVQALLRGQHDVLILSLFAGPPGQSWPRLDEMLTAVLGKPTRALIGIAWLFLGKDDHIGPGIVLRETTDRVDSRAERRFVVLAPPDRDDELSDWTWGNGGVAMPPLARYLMHMAKLRYQLRVHAALPDAAGLCQRLEHALELGDETELRASRFAIARELTARRTMRQTVAIASANAAAALGPAAGSPDDTDPIGDDRAVVRFLAQRIDDDITYLETAEDGARRMIEFRSPAPRPEPTFGIVTALPEEFAAARFMLAGEQRVNVRGDRANYFVGTLPSTVPDEPHVVVVTLLGETANNAAADGCANLIRSFGTVNCVLMSGIAAGVPRVTEPAKHVRLGDIVVASWGIVDYDHVVDTPGGVSLRQPHPRPSALLTHAVNLLRTGEHMEDRPWEAHIDAAVRTHPDFGRPTERTDIVHGTDDGTTPLPHPDPARSGHRPGRPKVHYGCIGSADRALRNLSKRDELAAEYDLRAVEMEGTGIGKSSFANGLEWYVVRGVSDYGDLRTGHQWRNYAALVAAAYVKALLGECTPLEARGGQARR